MLIVGVSESHPVVSNSLLAPCAFTPLKLTVWEWKTQIPTQSSSSTTSGPRWPRKASWTWLAVHHVGEALHPRLLQRNTHGRRCRHESQEHCLHLCHLWEGHDSQVEVQEERKWNPLPSNKKAVGYSLTRSMIHKQSHETSQSAKAWGRGQVLGMGSPGCQIWSQWVACVAICP